MDRDMTGDKKRRSTPPHLAPTDFLREQLQITAEEEAKAVVLMDEVSFGFAQVGSWEHIAWCLALDAIRRTKPGPKKAWSRTERLALVTAIERKLRERPGEKKYLALQWITEELRDDLRWQMAAGKIKVDGEDNPVPTCKPGARRSDLTAKALERVYEDTKPEWDRLEKLAQAQGWSLLDEGVSLSI